MKPKAKRQEPTLADRVRARVAADKVRGGSKCSTCSLPGEILDLIRAERSLGTHMAKIARALRAEGVAVNEGNLCEHFREHESR